jgi:hypothetical protein
MVENPELRNYKVIRYLVEGVGAGAPVGEEQRQANGLKNTGKGSNGDGVERALLGEDLRDNLRAMLVGKSHGRRPLCHEVSYDVPKEQRRRRR